MRWAGMILIALWPSWLAAHSGSGASPATLAAPRPSPLSAVAAGLPPPRSRLEDGPGEPPPRPPVGAAAGVNFRRLGSGFSRDRLNQAVAARPGRLFVDFTAAWCIHVPGERNGSPLRKRPTTRHGLRNRRAWSSSRATGPNRDGPKIHIFVEGSWGRAGRFRLYLFSGAPGRRAARRILPQVASLRP